LHSKDLNLIAKLFFCFALEGQGSLQPMQLHIKRIFMEKMNCAQPPPPPTLLDSGTQAQNTFFLHLNLVLF